MRVIQCSGIEICRPVLSQNSEKQNIQEGTVFETLQFIPYENLNKQLSFRSAVTIAVEIILQNCQKYPRKLKIGGFCCNGYLTQIVCEIFSRKPYAEVVFARNISKEVSKKYDLVIFEENMPEYCSFSNVLFDGAFVIYKGRYSKEKEECPLEIVFVTETESGRLSLLRKLSQTTDDDHCFVDIRNNNSHWMESLKTCMKENKSKIIYLIDGTDGVNGIIGLANSVIKGISNCQIKVITTEDNLSLSNDIYKNQIRKNLVFNVLKNNEWGTYVYFPLEDIGKREVMDAAVDIEAGHLSSLQWVQTPPARYE